jgi:CheY-like chemotaxis protein
MPVMDGYQATTLFREYESFHHAAKRLPVVALTANAMQGDRDRCLLAGMDDFLSKPFRMKDLRETITKWNPRHIAQLQPGPETL